MSEKAWKLAERRVASYLGGERVPITGRQRGDAPDVEHHVYSLEIKYRSRLPAWLFDARNQAEAASDGFQLPVTILLEKGMAVKDGFAILRVSDLRDWVG